MMKNYLIAGLTVLALLTAVPLSVQAGFQQLGPNPSTGRTDKNSDCQTRRDVKVYFQKTMTHVDVSNTHDSYVYLVTGHKPKLIEQALNTLREKGRDRDYVFYKFLWDACGENSIRQFQPED